MWRFLTDPAIGSRLRAGEYDIAAVHRHWVAYWRVVLEGVAVVVLGWLYLDTASRGSWVFFWLAAAVLCHGSWLFICLQSDVFVVTNRRIFRVRGPLGRKFATLPAARIVDYSVNQTLIGRTLDYGHFVFESAGQDQALHEIRYVPHPADRSNEIQDVVQPVEEGPLQGIDLAAQGGD